MLVTKRDGSHEEFDIHKIISAVDKAYKSCGYKHINPEVERKIKHLSFPEGIDIDIEHIQNQVEYILMDSTEQDVAKAFILYREKHKKIRDFVYKKKQFIENYKVSNNTANATIDDNSNVSSKNIGILNSEIHKEDNILINRGMIMSKLKELYPDFDSKQYIRDLENHIIYKHDENSFAGAISPYCCSITMYPFLLNGLKDIGGLSAAPKNLDSFCGMYINLIFAVSAQFAGAVATSEFLLYFDYFARKEWGNNYYLVHNKTITNSDSITQKTIRKQIHQYFQQVVYSINQPSAARGLQSAFINLSVFDKPFFEGMFGEFMFPDGSKPFWLSFNWLQKEFLHWFNQERLKCILTFPVVSATLLYKDNEFADKEMYDFICQEYSEGNSFFLYISDTVDSLSSCCFSADTKVLWKNSYDGVKCTTLKELYDLKWEPYKKNLKIYHNGSWVKGKPIKMLSVPMYKVTTSNNKEFIMTYNHINVTYNGEATTDKLTTDDYLMFNTKPLKYIKEDNQNLTYEQGLLVGLFIGDGTFGNYVCQDGNVHNFQLSLNESKWNKVKDSLNTLGEFILGKVYNNVYPVSCYNKELTTFISKWTTNEPLKTYAYNKNLNINCILQSKEFRKGILDGWYITDGGNSNRCYSISKNLIDSMEILCTSLGKQCIINVSDRTDEEVIIRGESYNRNYPLYCLRWYEDTNSRQRLESGFKWKNNSIYWKIKSIEKINYNEDVYCIQCNNEEEPYFTLPSGLITHNCRLKNKIQSKEFNFTNGNIGVQTGSKSVISLNLNRIIQDYFKTVDTNYFGNSGILYKDITEEDFNGFKQYLTNILERVYKYQTAYNELLWDMYNANLLPVYKAGFINLNKQYLTIGLIGLTAAADFLGIEVKNSDIYKEFCNSIFNTIKEQNQFHKTTKTTWNTELVPAESAAIKLYNADKKDGYFVPKDINLYTSYIFKPYNCSSPLEAIILHGEKYIGDYLDGGSACHINLEEHLSKEQYDKLLSYAASNGCQYLTFNIPNCECENCGFIAKQPFDKCPKCNSTNITLWDRIIGYLTKISNWSEGRQIEQTKRIYHGK